MKKYERLSGSGSVLTLTPMGLLVDMIVDKSHTVYLDKNTRSVSVDNISYTEANRGLFKELLELAEAGCTNIVIVTPDQKFNSK